MGTLAEKDGTSRKRRSSHGLTQANGITLISCANVGDFLKFRMVHRHQHACLATSFAVRSDLHLRPLRGSAAHRTARERPGAVPVEERYNGDWPSSRAAAGPGHDVSAQCSSKDPPLYHQQPSIDGRISAPGFHTDSDVQGRPQLLICACAYEPLSVPAHSSAGICCPSTSGRRATSRLYPEPNF